MRKDIDMLNGPLGPAIIRFTIPVILTTLVQTLFNTADMIVIGQFCGSLKVAAVSATSTLTNLLISLFTGLSLGAGLTVARALGSNQKEEISRAVHTAIPTALIGGVLLSVVGAIFSPTLLEWMNTPADVLPLASLYMQIYFSGIVFTIVYNFCTAILRAAGDTKTPLYFLIVAGILKVVLNVFVVAVCKLDVAGVALATILSQAVSAALVLMALARRTDECKLFLKKIRIYKKPLLDILRIGLPAGIQTSLISLANLINSTALNSFDSAAVLSGNGASLNLELFTDAIGIGFTQATPNFIAQNLGARQYDRIKKAFVTCMGYATVFVFTASMLMYLFRRQLLGLYITDSAEAIGYGLTRMRYVLIPGFLMAAMTVATGSLQGLGHSMSATVISLMAGCALRVLWILTIFAIPEYHTLDYLYVGYPISWIATTAIEAPLFFFFLKKKTHATLPERI